MRQLSRHIYRSFLKVWFMLSGRAHVIAFIMLLAGGFYYLNSLTPIQHDDYAYSFVYGDNPLVRPTEQRVVSLEDVLISQYNHYLMVNGRFILQFMVQLFVWLGKDIFNIANTIVFLFLNLLIFKLSAHRLKRYPFCKSVLIAVLLWWFLPFPGQTVLWLSGGCNYLWGTTLCVAFVLTMKVLLANCQALSTRTGSELSGSVPRVNKLFTTVLLFIFGAICGWSQETAVAGVVASTFLLAWVERKRFPLTAWSLLAGLFVGVGFLFLSPGTFNRVASEGVLQHQSVAGMLIGRLLNFFVLLSSLKILVVLALLLAIGFVFSRSDVFKQLRRDWYYYAIVFFGMVFAYLLGYSDERIGFGICIFSIICILNLFNVIPRLRPRWIYALTIAAVILTVFDYVKTIEILGQHKKYTDHVESVLMDSSERVIKNRNLPTSRFVLGHDFSSNPNDFHNRVRAFYYEKLYIIGLDAKLYKNLYQTNNLCQAKHEVFLSMSPTLGDMYTTAELPYVVVRLPDETLLSPENYSVIWRREIGPPEELSAIQRFIRESLGAIELKPFEKKNAFSVKIVTSDYLFLQKPSFPIAMCSEVTIEN